MVDPRGQRVAAALTAAVLAIVLLTGSAWLLAAQAGVFAAGALVLLSAACTPHRIPGTEIQDTEDTREILQVHLRGGEPCPRCGKPLRQIGGDEATTFCRTCQPPF